MDNCSLWKLIAVRILDNILIQIRLGDHVVSHRLMRRWWTLVVVVRFSPHNFRERPGKFRLRIFSQLARSGKQPNLLRLFTGVDGCRHVCRHKLALDLRGKIRPKNVVQLLLLLLNRSVYIAPTRVYILRENLGRIVDRSWLLLLLLRLSYTHGRPGTRDHRVGTTTETIGRDLLRQRCVGNLLNATATIHLIRS